MVQNIQNQNRKFKIFVCTLQVPKRLTKARKQKPLYEALKINKYFNFINLKIFQK